MNKLNSLALALPQGLVQHQNEQYLYFTAGGQPHTVCLEVGATHANYVVSDSQPGSAKFKSPDQDETAAHIHSLI